MSRHHEEKAMTEPAMEGISILLSRFIDKNLTGTKEMTDNLRRVMLMEESIYNCSENTRNIFQEGILEYGSDTDIMIIDNDVLVLYPGQSFPSDSTHKSVLYITKAREADCKPGYVTLQLGQSGQEQSSVLANSLSHVGENTFVSSDIFREQAVNQQSQSAAKPSVSHGPSSTYQTKDATMNTVVGFACKSWPRDADEWVTRTRVFGWPPQKLIDQIVCRGCHLVPLGANCSKDKPLQWRISLASAERALVYSLSHIQLKVYCLLKQFLTQLKNTELLRELPGDIFCSTLLKMLMFFSVENSHPMLWQEQNLFYCFWFCLNILISWVKTGTCPNYFIPSDNLFRQNIHGQNQQSLLDILTVFHREKLQCLSHEKFLRPTILESVCDTKVQAELMCTHTENEMEYYRDMGLGVKQAPTCQTSRLNLHRHLMRTMYLLMQSDTEVDEIIAFCNMTSLLSQITQGEASPDHIAEPTGNKARYQTLRKCKHRLTLCSSVATELCYLANFHFLSGNYSKSLQLCRQVMAQPSYQRNVNMLLPPEQKARYIQEYCGKGFTLIHKLRKTFTKSLCFENEYLYLPHLNPEMSKSPVGVNIPPLPFVVFLSFLCCHELGDTRGRDAALRHLIVVKYDDLNGGHTNWTVHTLLGICYETLGDHHRAIRSYMDSEQSKTEFHDFNPALERIGALQRSDRARSEVIH
ncbi:uncharacterized protein LOC110446767 [Mizuhopecten yessoensis]|uniref:uncharacterized protein LOC110446767 n=1 Tax=Mizuhopecten yessoensis TaxID=6573 RepID=UPI000B45F767|nr:uncharacterized protein LOC110446767 [Mizuhopecten yessoensis]